MGGGERRARTERAGGGTLARSRIFVLVLAAGLVTALAVPVLALPAGGSWAVVAVVDYVAVVVCAGWLLRRPSAVVAWLLTGLVVVLLLVPGPGGFAVFLLLVAAASVGMLAGMRVGTVAAAMVSLALMSTMLVDPQGPGLESALQQTLGLGLVLVLAVGFGALARAAELDRALAARQRAELAQAHERLRASMATERELVLAQERARSAREMHDGVGHLLTLVSMSLEFAQRTRDRDDVRAWAEVEVAAATTQEALAAMRLWVRALNPPSPRAGVGGAEAFGSVVDAFRGTGLEVRVDHRGDVAPLPDGLTLFATRFLQEALTNVLRHSAAGEVEITILQSPAQVRLAVRDDGTAVAAAPEGFGLRSLRERAEALGGSVSAGPVAGGGWQVVSVLPLDSDNGEPA